MRGPDEIDPELLSKAADEAKERLIRRAKDPDSYDAFNPPPAITEVMKQIIGRQEHGAIPNGRRIKKIASFGKGDILEIGSEGTVLGSLASRTFPVFIDGELSYYAYIVEWDDFPGAQCGTVDISIEEI